MRNKLIYYMIGMFFIFSTVFVSCQLKKYPFSPSKDLSYTFPVLSELSYTKASRSLFGGQTILSNVTIPSYPFIQSIDKIKFGYLTPTKYKIEFIHAQINILDLILKKEPSKALLLKHLKDYIPYQDLLQQPLLTLLLINSYILELDALLTIQTVPSLNKALIRGNIQIQDLFSVSFHFDASPLSKDIFKELLTFLINPTSNISSDIIISPISYTWTNNGFYEKYREYLKTLPHDFVKESQGRNFKVHKIMQQKTFTESTPFEQILQKGNLFFTTP